MLQEVKFSVPRVLCYLEYQDPSKPLGEDMIVISRVLPSTPQRGDQIAISTDDDWFIGEVVLVRWHFTTIEKGNEYVTVKIRALPKAKGESEADNG